MKNKNTYALLALFLGGLGLHKFYVGQTGYGILHFMFFPLGALLGFLSGLYWLLSSNENFDNKYNDKRIQREILNSLKTK